MAREGAKEVRKLKEKKNWRKKCEKWYVKWIKDDSDVVVSNVGDVAGARCGNADGVDDASVNVDVKVWRLYIVEVVYKKDRG